MRQKVEKREADGQPSLSRIIKPDIGNRSSILRRQKRGYSFACTSDADLRGSLNFQTLDERRPWWAGISGTRAKGRCTVRQDSPRCSISES